MCGGFSNLKNLDKVLTQKLKIETEPGTRRAAKEIKESLKEKIHTTEEILNSLEDIRRKEDRQIQTWREELNKLSVKSVAGDKFSERLLLNNSFLVEKNRFAQFSDKVGELEQKYPDLKFLYSGPWPAYSFVNINIKAGG